MFYDLNLEHSYTEHSYTETVDNQWKLLEFRVPMLVFEQSNKVWYSLPKRVLILLTSFVCYIQRHGDLDL